MRTVDLWLDTRHGHACGGCVHVLADTHCFHVPVGTVRYCQQLS